MAWKALWMAIGWWLGGRWDHRRRLRELAKEARHSKAA